MTTLFELLGLFVVALGAASLLPLQSEPLFIAMLLAERAPPWLLVVVASAGNILGSFLNWVIGTQLARFQDRHWFPLTPAQLDRGTAWYARWGRWSLLLSWAPFIGDPLTIAAGVLREPLPSFLFLVSIAKAGRYLALAFITLAFR